ncbi:hypothetical protein ABZT28_34125 [Streptomyces sp. NPDC005388]
MAELIEEIERFYESTEIQSFKERRAQVEEARLPAAGVRTPGRGRSR